MKHLLSINILSEISLPETKADSVSDTSCGNSLFSRWQSTFEIILYPTLHRLMGRNSVILLGRTVFGMRQILVIFILSSKYSVLKNSLTILVISDLIIEQDCWKNKDVFSSGPGPFSGCIMNKADLTSSSDA